MRVRDPEIFLLLNRGEGECSEASCSLNAVSPRRFQEITDRFGLLFLTDFVGILKSNGIFPFV